MISLYQFPLNKPNELFTLFKNKIYFYNKDSNKDSKHDYDILC